MKKTIVITTLILVAIVILLFWPAVHTGTPVSPNLQAKRELHQLQMACLSYKTYFGAFPTGSVAVVCQALTEKNSIAFIEFSPRSTAPDGTFLDPWGTPYRFVFVSSTNLIVSSAGKDRSWGTTDDIEVK